MSGSRPTFVEDMAFCFAMYCDQHALTTTQADDLARELDDAVQQAADARRDALPAFAPELIDDAEDA